MEGTIDIGMILSGVSFVVTTYFWFVKSRKEKPHLEFFQLADFRAACRRHPENREMKRLCLQQVETGGVLIVNHSIRQNSIVVFDCYLLTEQGEIQGDWGRTGDDKPPWNVGPESTIAFSPACFFDVPEDFELADNPRFRLQFITASGKQFSHCFAKQAPRLRSTPQAASRAA